jgi:hypothetical protein
MTTKGGSCPTFAPPDGLRPSVAIPLAREADGVRLTTWLSHLHLAKLKPSMVSPMLEVIEQPPEGLGSHGPCVPVHREHIL